MSDPRLTKLAQVLVHYSLGLKEGDLFHISTRPVAAPLVRELCRETLAIGAHPLVDVSLEDVTETLFRYGSDAQLQYVPNVTRQLFEDMQATLQISASENTKYLSGINPSKVALRGKALSGISQRIVERDAAGELTWAITLYPTQAAAQDAEMSLADYEDFVYNACKLNESDPVAAWQAVHQQQQRLADILQTKQVIRLVAPETDLTYHTSGRTWINADGKKNFPDGEVFTSPDETKTEGHIHFTYPAIFAGRAVEDVRLVFSQGNVIAATASRGEDLLHSQIAMDEGACRLGEAAFGTNYHITRHTKNILFDEKIGGSIHLALGQSFPEIGGQNTSALHWDMVCDMHQGEAYADGELIYKDGKFVI
jgi:aminopeptidase